MKLFLAIFQKIIVFGGLAVGAFVFIFVFIFDSNMDKVRNLKNRLLGRKLVDSENNSKKQVKNSSVKNQNKKVNKKNKGKDNIQIVDAKEFLDFEDIKIFESSNPIGLIMKKSKKEFVGVIEVRGVNYNLLSIEEREILEESFAKLLNGIGYPMQIFIQSRKIEIDQYDASYTKRLEEIEKSLKKMMDKLEFSIENKDPENKIQKLKNNIDRLNRQYSYGVQIKNWIIAKCKEKNMLERKYYIVISHEHNKNSFKNQLTEKELLNNAFFDISNKANSLVSALQKANLDGKLLTGYELADLLYRSYNKADSEHYKLKNALKNRFSHFCTTAEPIEIKKLQRKAEEIDNSINEIETNSKEMVGV